MTSNLGLDEALISVHRSSHWGPIEVYYQIDECFGCPLDYLTRLYSSTKLASNDNNNGTNLINQNATTSATNYDENSFVIGTKYDFRLELRNTESGDVCRFNHLSLNNHGHYQIDVPPESKATLRSPFDCTITTIDKGDCYLCPIAVVLLVLIAFTVLEKLCRKFWPELRGRLSRSTSAPPGSQRAQNIDNPNFHSSSEKRSTGGPDGGNTSVVDASGATTDERVTVEVAEDGSRDNEQRHSTGAATLESDVGANGSDEQSQKQQPSVVASASGSDVEANSTSTSPAAQKTSRKRVRVESLDTFRGLTIAGMIFANYGGAGYVFLEHKPWDGITAADFVFPFFIFSMGASIALSTRSQLKRGLTIRGMSAKILRRAIILMVVGLCLNSRSLTEKQNLNHLRLTGVLQRFSISYLAVALMYAFELSLGKWFQAQSLTRIPALPAFLGVMLETLTALYNLSIYIWVTFYLNYDSNCPIGYTGPGGHTEGSRYANCTGGAAAWLDRTVLGDSHIYQDRNLRKIFKANRTHDPEGLLGYSTSIVLTLIGLQCGKLLITSGANANQGGKHHKVKIMNLIQWFLIVAAACLCAIAIPINKRLWSMSFIMVTGATAYLIMLLLYILVDIYHIHREMFLIRLLNSAGKNALFLYVGHSLLSNMLPWHFVVDETSHLQLLLRLTWATFAWLLLSHFMALKGFFIKI